MPAITRDDGSCERHAVVARPGWSKALAGAIENIRGAVAEERGCLPGDILCVVEEDVPAQSARDFGEDLPVHYGVGA